jgi:6-pyruvoyl-tetrahydropterin synthase related domain
MLESSQIKAVTSGLQSKALRPASLSALIVLAVTLSVAPILLLGIPSGPDLSSHLRFAQAFATSMSEGNIYPAWQHEANAGYGDGSFRIYSPLSYYILVGSSLLGKDWFVGMKVLLWLATLAGAAAVYYWTKAWASSLPAALAALVYCFAPFRINEIYQAALLPEFIGAALLALLLGLTERLGVASASRKQRLLWQIQFGIAAAALVFAHIPLAMMAVLTIPLYALVRFEKPVRLSRLVDLALAGFLGALLSAFYWVNLLRELPLLKGTTIQPGVRFDLKSNFAFALNSNNLSGWYVNLLFVMTAVLLASALPLVLTSRNTVSLEQRRALLAVIVVALFTLFMATPLSIPVWAIVPRLAQMEFPWRWLAAASILASGSAGFSIWSLWTAMHSASTSTDTSASDKTARVKHESRSRLRLLAAMGCLIIAISFSLTYPIRNALFLDRSNFATTLELSQHSPGLEEWLPRWTSVNAVLELQQGNQNPVGIAGRNVSVQSWLAQKRRFTVGEGDKAVARVRTLFYPYWHLQTLAGLALPTHPDADGVLLADIPAGPQTIEMNFVTPPHQYVGDALSSLGVLALAVLSYFSLRRKKFISVA